MAGSIRIGTAGWGISTRLAASFPGSGTHLGRYGRRLGAVEINSSFYRPHQRRTYERWAASVPDDFRFCVKVPKAITHDSWLRADAGALDRFCDEIAGLGAKLGVVLVQLPPGLRFEPDVLEAFVAGMRARMKVRIACEPRHKSWFDGAADRLMERLDVARVAADPARHPGADMPGGSSRLVYFRLHGSPRIYHSDYPPVAIADMAARIDAARDAEIWCVFDNTAQGHALGNAVALADFMVRSH